ncbi:MAG TPA: divergent polysaccharide deacetylase family protein [Candidatus Krumholzibacteria bacterium]
MPRRKSKDEDESKPSRVPGSVKFFTAFLLVLAVGGSIGINFMKSTRGAVFLVDQGAVLAFDRVQRDAGRSLRHALEQQGLRRNIRVVRDAKDATREQPIEWDITCAESTDLLQVNAALSDALAKEGLVVRRSEEFENGRTLVFEVGSHTATTHRLTLRLASADAIARQAPPREKRPRIALVIDDLGYAKGGIAREFLDLDIPLTVSILPTLRYSRDILDLAKEKHRCILLHLPMQSEERERIDVEPVTTGMSDAEIASVVRGYVDSLPGIDGVNNHQGSLATTDARVMHDVMVALQGRNLFFLDSLTSPKSLAYNAAVQSGLRAAQNSMFIDDDTERTGDVADRIRELVKRARETGVAIGIGHPHPWTLEALRDNLDYLEEAGVELVTVCDLVGASAPDSTAR